MEKKYVAYNILKNSKMWQMWGLPQKCLLLERTDGDRYMYLLSLAIKEDASRYGKYLKQKSSEPFIPLVQVLCHMRVNGCYLEQLPSGKLAIRHTLGVLPEGYVGFETEDQYDFFKQHLMPFKGWMVSALVKVSKL